MKNTIVSVAVLLLVGCVANKTVGPTKVDVERVATIFDNYTLADLKQGKKDYERYCDSCHGLENPASFTENEWRQIVPDMVNGVNDKENITLDAKTEESILRYLITMSSAPKPN